MTILHSDSFNTRHADSPAPGLLPILQQAAILRFVLILLEIGFYMVTRPGRSILDWPMLVFTLERALLVSLMISAWPRRQLGRWFLPIALGWLFIFPMLELALSAAFTDRGALFIIGRLEARDIGSPLIWLAVPMVLAAWQYGNKGVQIGLGLVVAEYVFVGALMWSGMPILGGFMLDAISRIVMLALLGYVVAHLVEAQRTEHRALAEANRRLEQRAATIEQLAESRERNRMAREMHDTLAHSLTGLSVQLQALGTLMEHDPQAAQPQLREIQKTVRTGTNEVRRAILELRATPLEDLGLSQALKRLCRSQEERTGIHFAFDIVDVPALNPLTEQAVYRIAEAALANVEQHAAATEVVVGLQVEGSADPGRSSKPRLKLEIRDDGLGFDPQSVPKGRFGLAGMAERAELAGGSLDVESGRGQGTRIVLNVPAD